MSKAYTQFKSIVTLLVLAAYQFGCSKDVETSVGAVKRHAPMLVETTAKDVNELRNGMPEGAAYLSGLFLSKTLPKDDLVNVRTELERARNKVLDLRVAKSTFFALVDRDGTVLRTDREPDLMSGKNLFAAYPVLRSVLERQTVEGVGSMSEAATTKGRNDGQFVRAVPIVAGDVVVGAYASGWSWMAYAYRLENALRSDIRAQMKSERDKEPLVYVYVIVGDSVFGAPVSPQVNADTIKRLDTLSKTSGEAVFLTPIEITGREFGLAVKRAPLLGPNVAIAVLRSET
jgi:hypothetical protein